CRLGLTSHRRGETLQRGAHGRIKLPRALELRTPDCRSFAGDVWCRVGCLTFRRLSLWGSERCRGVRRLLHPPALAFTSSLSVPVCSTRGRLLATFRDLFPMAFRLTGRGEGGGTSRRREIRPSPGLYPRGGRTVVPAAVSCRGLG